MINKAFSIKTTAFLLMFIILNIGKYNIVLFIKY